MTLLTRWLSHLIHACEMGQKQHAWRRAQELAEMCPHELAELPELLKAAMLSSSRGLPEPCLQTPAPTGELKHQSPRLTSRLAGR